jgi:hypothetical protein
MVKNAQRGIVSPIIPFADACVRFGFHPHARARLKAKLAR